jgi:PAS domain S-box-containing protein
LDTSNFFETFFINAKHNGIIIMETDGTVLSINDAFRLRFGYFLDDLKGKNFKILFIEKDREMNKPEMELKTVLSQGSANDENYLVSKEGNKIWVTGESVLIKNKENEQYVVKIVHNIHAQKQLERFLLESHEFIDTVFDSVDESALLLLNSRLRIIKVNKAFITMFELTEPIQEKNRLSDLDNPFWQRADVKQAAVNYLVTHDSGTPKIFDLELKSGEIQKINFRGKLVEGVPGADRKLLIMIKRV